MNWDAFGAIAEMIGSVAVILTLAYLAIQLRQNTEATKSAARFESGRYWSSEAMEVATNPDIARILAAGLKNAKTLDDEERERFFYWITQAFLIRDTMFQEYSGGLFPEDLWQTHKKVLRGLLEYDAVRRIFDAGAMPLSDDFIQYLAKLKEESEADSNWNFDEKARIFD